MACLKTHEVQAECEELSVRREKVWLCAVSRRSPNHIRANESIPPSVMAPPAQGPRKKQAGGGREGGRKSGRRDEI